MDTDLSERLKDSFSETRRQLSELEKRARASVHDAPAQLRQAFEQATRDLLRRLDLVAADELRQLKAHVDEIAAKLAELIAAQTDKPENQPPTGNS